MAAEAIVSTVLKQLALIVGKEVVQGVRIVVDVGKEIEKLTSNFEAIQTVLVDAEQRQVKETAVGVWLDKLKDASYDMDNVLDEWNTEVLELQIEGDANAQFWKNVCFLFSYPCFCFRQIALRHDIGVKIKEMNENLDSIAKLKGRYNLTETRSIEKPQKPETTLFIEVSDICGRDNEKKKLVNMLLSEGNEALPVFSIVGMGGIGKTTLAQLACKDAKIIKNKFDKIIWVCVSDPFDERRIARAIIGELKGRATDLVTLQSLLDRLSETVENKKLLLILDDVWEENDDKWKQLYNSLKDSLHGGSRILVTTRKEKVARMMKSIDGIDIGVLSLDDSWWLFKQVAFCDRSQEECEKLENIGRKIVVKCKGLPLAIKTIGSLLRFTKPGEWQRILESEIWKLKGLEGLFPPLLLSYNVLPFWVKRCFSYCAIFPKDYEMRKNELIELWMAQGYFDSKCDEELEIIGEECFDTLAMHFFFQELSKDPFGNDTCKMHDIVHDFAQFLVKNECFSKEIYGSEEASLDVSCEKARHSMLILKSSYNVNISSVQKLRSLLIEGELGYESVSSCFSPNLFKQMTCLRSLKLSGGWDNKIPSEIGKLIHLRYLNMSKLNIKKLPETLCCLYNLQTLNIRDCMYLEKLPKGMGKLINLRHLINQGTKNLRYMPKEMEGLVCLRTLGRFIVGGDPNGTGLGCLKNLNKLRGRLMIKGLGEVVDKAEAKNAQLMNKKNLVRLQLYFDSASDASSTKLVKECNKDSAVLEALQPPPNLEILLIDGCSMTSPPHWMVSLIHLKNLDLKRCGNCEYLPALGKLPRLEGLTISGMKSVKRVGNEFVGIETSSSSSSSPSLIAFPKLKYLNFHSMENWEEWEYKITAGDITIMLSLSKLSIYNCPKLKSLPDHLLHATTLEQLVIRGCDLEYLPALGKLPRLEYLDISGMESVKRVGNEFVGIETSSSSSSSPSLIAFPKLKRLTFWRMENWEEWEYKITAGDITIMPSLSFLEIKCPKLKSLPNHLLHSTSLEKLTINVCNCKYLPALGKLPRLEELYISGMKSVKRVGNEFVGIETSSSSSSSPSVIAFPKLKRLYFRYMDNLEEWEYKITAGDITIMPSLSHLSIYYCPKLKSLPDHLLHSTSLKTSFGVATF